MGVLIGLFFGMVVIGILINFNNLLLEIKNLIIAYTNYINRSNR